ncbi:MAG: acyl-CoA thioesterase [Rhodospirillaceae bacterium]|jgi:acyl-CoA thioester hydrolase|nr:acyl-CoA thioesterase [Rhodospirillaceae bacterium]MBT5455564.1 acyl-CoA thioesterase [Rhodospirillaceae bacterium]
MTDQTADFKSRVPYATWTTDSVRYADLDPNGHANNGAINQFFEDGRVNFRSERMSFLGGDLFTGFAVGRFAATYHAALTYPAMVDIGTVVTRIGTASFDLAQGVFHGDRCIATATVGQVHFDHKTGKSMPLPDPIRAALEGARIAEN